jgi:hypothetical protein
MNPIKMNGTHKLGINLKVVLVAQLPRLLGDHPHPRLPPSPPPWPSPVEGEGRRLRPPQMIGAEHYCSFPRARGKGLTVLLTYRRSK